MYVCRFLAIVFALCLIPAASYAQAVNTTGTFSGTVTTGSGAPISSAQVTAEGPSRASVATDASGSFKLTLAAGIYRVTVTKGGYVPATLSDLAIVSGGTQVVAVTMTLADLSTLRTIASVSTGSRASSINTGAATSSFVPAVEIANLANPQINDVLQREPEVVIQRQGSQPDTTIVAGAVQPYETQVLIDGHPISLGEYGVWLTQYFPSFLLSGMETQIGPGNTTAFASTAVGGTTNLVTQGFTGKPTANLVLGTDSYGSQYSNLVVTGAFNKLAYVLGAGYGSNNGPYYNQTHCVVTPDNPANDNTPASTGIVQFCGDSSASLFTKGTIFKLRYTFSPRTSFEAGFVGAYGGFLPQGTSYGQYLGQTTIEPCLTSNPLACNNPSNNSQIGQSVPAYAWYPGSNVYYNQPIFTGQLRQSFGNDTLLIRPYAGNIEWVLDGAGEDHYPLYFSAPGTVPTSNPTFANCTAGATSTCNAFEQACYNSFIGQIIGYNSTPTVLPGGYEQCYQTQFSELSQDKLYGNTLSYIHPVGNDLFTFTYDFHGDHSYGYYNANIPSDVTVPSTLMHYTTLSLVGDMRLSRTVGAKVGLYQSIWSVSGSQNVTPYATPDPNTGLVPQIPLQRSVSRFDPHVALTYQPTNNISYRAAFGTSATYPFSGYISGAPFYTPPSATSGTVAPNGFVTFKSPYLNPETSTAESLGMDWRLRPNGILRVDLINTQVYDVFEELATPTAIMWPGSAQTGIDNNLVTTVQPTNAARLSSQLAMIGYDYAPLVGFGYNAAMVFQRSVVSGIPLAFYGIQPSLPANNVQICGFGLTIPGSVTCIPYMKGYYQVNYTWKHGTYVGLGADFQGKNNTYFQPPFLQFDLTAKTPITRSLEAQISVQNLLNTNNFYNLPMPNSGTTTTLGQYGAPAAGLPAVYSQTTTPSTLIPAPPRTFRFQLRWHFGRP